MKLRFLPAACVGCLAVCLLLGFVAGCSSKVEDSGKPKNADGTKGENRSKDNGARLTKDYFPITSGQERTFTQRGYTRKDYKNPRPEIFVREEKWMGVWTTPNTSETKTYGRDCQVWKSDRIPKFPTGPSRKYYRTTDQGVEIGDTYGTANPKHPGAGLTYWIALLKWDAKPGDSWTTEVALLKRTFTATFEKSVVFDGKQCASIVIVEENRDDNLFHLNRYWLMSGVGLVKLESFGCDPRYYKALAGTWMPQNDRTFGEWKGDTQPLTFQDRQP